MLSTCDGDAAPIVALTSEATAEPAPPTPIDTPVVKSPTPATPEPVSGGVPPADKDNCPESHPIKGNQGQAEYIYHLPGGAYFGGTDPEECFATEADAQAAGYRKASR